MASGPSVCPDNVYIYLHHHEMVGSSVVGWSLASLVRSQQDRLNFHSFIFAAISLIAIAALFSLFSSILLCIYIFILFSFGFFFIIPSWVSILRPLLLIFPKKPEEKNK